MSADCLAVALHCVIHGTAAILAAEAATERWVCPVCGGLNPVEEAARPVLVYIPESAGRNAWEDTGLSWCQHGKCVERRAQTDKLFGMGFNGRGYSIFEITFPAYTFYVGQPDEVRA